MECDTTVIEELTHKNRKVALHHTTTHLGFAYGVVHDTVVSQLHKQEICTAWCKNMCKRPKNILREVVFLLDKDMNVENGFLNYVITGDITWLHHFAARKFLKGMAA